LAVNAYIEKTNIEKLDILFRAVEITNIEIESKLTPLIEITTSRTIGGRNSEMSSKLMGDIPM